MMTSPAMLLLVPLLGVTFGYEPSSDSDVGYDYTVQVEPELLAQLEKGGTDAIETNIPPEVTPIRRIRVVVGHGDLPKRLRPVERTAFRQDLDAAASPAIDLLAQTGPAGGYGRSATGFNGAATRSSTAPATTVPNSVPAIGTQYPTPTTDIRGQLDQAFQSAETGLVNTRDAVRGTVNNVGATGQQVIDNTRQTISDMVAPPENRSFSADNTPLQNLSGRVQNEFGNTTQAMRDSWDRTSQSAREAFGVGGQADPAARSATGGTAAPQWTGNDDRYAQRETYPVGTVGADERSVLQANQAQQPAETGLTQAERELLLRIDRDRQYQQQQELAAQQLAAQQRNAAASGSTFPEQPMQPLPRREQDDVIFSMGNRPQTVANTPAPQQPASTVPTPPQGNNATTNSSWMFANNNQQQTPQAVQPPAIGNNIPQITDVSLTQNQQAEHPDTAAWLEDSQQQSDSQGDGRPQDSSTPVWLLGWTIAVGSVVTNLFQWLNIVDMRNKYRVALRRSSPNFARSMAA